MALNVGGIERGIVDAVVTIISTGAVTFGADAAVEAGRIPYLDDVVKSNAMEPTLSNYEKTLYSIGGILFTLGVVDIATHHKLFGIGRWAVPASLGLIGGTSLYEAWGAEFLGIRRSM